MAFSFNLGNDNYEKSLQDNIILSQIFQQYQPQLNSISNLSIPPPLPAPLPAPAAPAASLQAPAAPTGKIIINKTTNNTYYKYLKYKKKYLLLQRTIENSLYYKLL
jgi:hypothetical protein